MVAPLIPRLSARFGTDEQTLGLVVPAYLIPYGLATLFYGLLSDRIGRRRIMFASLAAFTALTALTATAANTSQLILWRFLTGLGASGVVPLALALIGEVFPYEKRGRPLGWLFGAMAGGMAFGSTVGVVLEPFIGWQMLFIGTAAAGALVLLLLHPHRSVLDSRTAPLKASFPQVLRGYADLLSTARATRTYSYVFLNGVFHSGVYTWLGLYLARRYQLGEIGIGLALLGYGIPGFLLGPAIGRLADRWGRSWLIPLGLAVSAVAAATLVPSVPLILTVVAITVLSLGYDMTQPLLAGIVTHLGGKRPGQTMGLNVFALFCGFGVGSLLFGKALVLGLGEALVVFSAVQLVLALVAVSQFRDETGNLGVNREPRNANKTQDRRSSA